MSRQSGSDNKPYLRSLQGEEMSADRMPKKTWRKWKRKERQRGKKLTEERDV